MEVQISSYRLIGCRRTMHTVRDLAPAAARAVTERYGRQPLAPAHIVLTTPAGLAHLYRTSQATAAGIPHDRASRLPEYRPRDLYGITGLGPTGSTLTLLNARRLRDAVDAVAATLLHELVRVDQLNRRGGRRQHIARLRALCGIDPLSRHQRALLDQRERDQEREAIAVERALLRRLTTAQAA